MKVLVVVDAQVDFITGALANPEAEKRVPNIVKKIETAAENGDMVIFTKDTHFEDTYKNSLEGQKLPVPHCIEGTDGWELEPRILDAANKIEASKVWFYSKYTFGAIEMAIELMNISNIDEIEIIGFVSSICVASNALLLRAAMPNMKITCDASCCAGLAKEDHDAAMIVMKCCQIDVVGED